MRAHDVQAFNLVAAAFVAQDPGAEVLTVVGQQTKTIFTEARTCAFDHLGRVEEPLVVPDQDFMAVSEMLEGSRFHRPTSKSIGKSGVVNDAAVADIDAMMRIESARRHEVSGEGRLLASAKQ
jgi:hypothetical protein